MDPGPWRGGTYKPTPLKSDTNAVFLSAVHFETSCDLIASMTRDRRCNVERARNT